MKGLELQTQSDIMILVTINMRIIGFLRRAGSNFDFDQINKRIIDFFEGKDRRFYIVMKIIQVKEYPFDFLNF